MKKILMILVVAIATVLSTVVQAQDKSDKTKGKSEEAKAKKEQKEVEKKKSVAADVDSLKTTGSQKDKDAKENEKTDQVKKTDADKEAKEDRGDHQDTTSRGNAYGRNKGDLTGREFGKLRSTEAKSKVKTKLDEMDREITAKEKSADDNRKKVEEADARVEKEKKDKKLTEKQYKEKKARIALAGKKVDQMDSITTVKREEWRKMKAEVEKEETPQGQQ